MYHVDLQGNMVFEKLALTEERIDLLDNPLLGPILRHREELLESEKLQKRANKIAMYYLNIDKRFDLDNYLAYKPITPMDFVRCAWYYLSYYSGYADMYRNEQYWGKSDFWYEHERKMLILNFNNPDKSVVAANLLKCLNFDYEKAIRYIESNN